MLRIIRYGFAAAAALVLALLVAALTLPQWLGPAIAALLPAGWQLDELAVEPQPPGLPTLRRLVLSAGGCRALVLERARVTIGWRGRSPALERVEVEALTVDPACLRARAGAALGVVDPPSWLSASFDGSRLQVRDLVVAGWLGQAHRLELAVADGRLDAALEGPELRLAGDWQAGAGIVVRELAAARQQLSTPALTVLRPQLVLEGPARLDPASGWLTADARLSAQRLNLTAAGKLDQPAVRLHLEGPAHDLRWTAEAAAANGIGPVRAAGSWSGGTLSGRLTLAGQALPALRPVLPPTLPVQLQAGQAGMEAELAWSLAAPSDLRLDGELVVSQARLGLTHAVAEGVAARLPFRYAGGVVHLGGRQPGELSVDRVAAAVEIEGASARIAGAWPWSVSDPLRIEGLRVRALGGEATLDGLRLPQHGQSATLRLRGIQLDQVSTLYGDAVVSLSGAVEADLPLHLDDATRLVADGVIRNATPLRLRLTDAAALQSFKATNPTLARAADWLADLHVDRLEGTVNLQRDGALLLVATIEGRNPEQGERPVVLNYRHEENLLHLLQSLRIGSDLSRGIEERVSPRSRSGP